MFGGERHLALAAPLIRGAARPWPSPFERRNRRRVGAIAAAQVCVLASGDPFHLRRRLAACRAHIDPRRDAVVPAPRPSAWRPRASAGRCRRRSLLSLHGRALDLVRPHLHRCAHPRADLGRRGPGMLARLLADTGLRPFAPDGARGARRAARTHPEHDRGGLRSRRVDPLNAVAIEVAATPSARVLARAAACPMRCSSTTARSPSARSAR